MNEVKVGLNLEVIRKTVDTSLLNHPLFTYRGEVIYGVPRETSESREYDKDTKKPVNDEDTKKPINNAELLAIHENGSPKRNIRPRPLLQPVFEKHRNQIDKEMAKVAGRLLEGDKQGADEIMGRLAFRIETWCKEYFTSPDNGWRANKPETIKAWLRKSKKKAKGPVNPEDKKPLIDTSELRKSIRGMLIEGDND